MKMIEEIEKTLAKSRTNRLEAILNILKNASSTKTIKLEILGLEVPVPYKYHFCDDGYVANISKHKNKLLEKYGLEKIKETKKEEKEKNKITMGFAMKIPFNGELFIHISYVNYANIDKIINIETRAHEETHVLQFLDKLDILEKKLSEKNVKIDLSKYDKEIVASLGSVYALDSRKIDPEEVFIIKMLRGIKDRPLGKAIRIYEKAKRK